MFEFVCEGEKKKSGLKNVLRIKLDFLNFAEDHLGTAVRIVLCIEIYQMLMQPVKMFFLYFLCSKKKRKSCCKISKCERETRGYSFLPLYLKWKQLGSL